MKNKKLLVLSFSLLTILIISCGIKQNSSIQNSNRLKEVNLDHFAESSEHLTIETVSCILSNGDKSNCFQITTKGFSADHKMGPWCPETINDSKEKGGLWFKDGIMYDVDGEFVQNLATLYDDQKWLMYDEQGNVNKARTKAECQKLAGAQLVEEYTNFCIECLPEFVSELTKSYTIPIQPVMVESPVKLNDPNSGGAGRPKGPPSGGDRPKGPPPGGERPKGPRPGGGGGPSIRGVALNGIAFDAPAPVNLILSGYTIPPLDDAGGHVNMDAGYHYHATTGLSKEIIQADGHAPLIGYAIDGIGLYAHTNADGSTDEDLDDCRGHYDEIRGYHYHVDGKGSNNFINCFSGAVAIN